MKNIAIAILTLSLFFGFASCCDHESEFNLSECVKFRVANDNQSKVVIDVQLLPPLYSQAYQDSINPFLVYATADINLKNNVGEKVSPSEKIEEGGVLWYRYKLSSLKYNSEYTFALEIPAVFFGDGKESLHIGVSGSSSEGYNNRIYPENNTFVVTTMDIAPVDLGLSVLWANTDLGVDAENITKYQELYSWSKSIITGLPPYKNISGTSEDIASSILGDGWRTPTATEMQELIDNCTWSNWSIVSGLDPSKIITNYKRVYGKGKYQNTYIELYPYANKNEKNFIGAYWTASVAEENSATNKFTVNYLSFSKDGQYIIDMPYDYTTTYCIRPVKDK